MNLLSIIHLFQELTLFLVMRGLLGVGEASYSYNMMPTIIADLFTGNIFELWALSVLYIAIPVGR